jgi:hypothetical protein
MAWISFNLFEQRFLRLKRHFEPAFPEAVLEPSAAGDSLAKFCRTVGTGCRIKSA